MSAVSLTSVCVIDMFAKISCSLHCVFRNFGRPFISDLLIRR
jgi:hypothetical protein